MVTNSIRFMVILFQKWMNKNELRKQNENIIDKVI